MLEKLDTLVAFVVVMLGVSLIITILTQIVASFLALRGSNLLWGIEALLNDLDPKLDAKLQGAESSVRKLAEGILTDEVISDSTFSRADDMWLVGPVIKFLRSLPGAKWLIQRWRYASAIRPEELARMLDKEAILLASKAAGAASASGSPGTPATKVPPSPAAAAAALASTALTDLLGAPDLETSRKLDQLNKALTAFVQPASPHTATPPGFAVQVDKIFQQATDAAQRSVEKLETSFNTVMDRVSQRFALEMRLWTVVFAFAVAFGVHLDSFRLLDQLSTNTDVRSALVNMRDSMLTEANAVLPSPGASPGAPEVPVSAKILNEAMDNLRRNNAGLSKVGQIPANTTTVSDAVEWLTAQPGAAAAGQAYRLSVVSVLRAHAVDINQQLVRAGVELIPTPYPGFFTYGGKRNFLGILIAAALLSLGAPFWYNTLKNLSNLRTMVASKQEQEQPTS